MMTNNLALFCLSKIFTNVQSFLNWGTSYVQVSWSRNFLCKVHPLWNFLSNNSLIEKPFLILDWRTILILDWGTFFYPLLRNFFWPLIEEAFYVNIILEQYIKTVRISYYNKFENFFIIVSKLFYLRTN